ncbi:MAG TPA: two pore domain potassium channel family protein [Leptolyngbyaceae cyanobacterium M65_K2018_010]|nr:two pore domain potassium channel family protein [Leptolyngbyaceae cyanobacterium M65_K2018_010]
MAKPSLPTLKNQRFSRYLHVLLNPYLLLIFSILSILASIVNRNPSLELVTTGLLTVIMILIILRGTYGHHVAPSKRGLTSLVLLALTSYLWDAISYLSPRDFALKSTFFFSAVLIRVSIFSYGWWLLTKTLLRRQKVTHETIIIAIVAYLFIGIVYSFIYHAIWKIDPEAFHVSIMEDFEFGSWNLSMYFSFMTLTTVGYGDIAPINRWVMALSNFEAMTGSIYLTVIIARLVSLYSNSD